MGRKDYRQVAQRGPGPKARRQKDPKLPPELLGVEKSEKSEKSLSSRQKKRLKKRLEKSAPKAGAKKQQQQQQQQQPEDAHEASDASMEADDEPKLRLDLGDDDDDEVAATKDQIGNGASTLLEEDDDEYLNDDFGDLDDASDSEEAAAKEEEEESISDVEGDAGESVQRKQQQQQQQQQQVLEEANDLSELDGQIDQLLQALSVKGGVKELGLTRCDCVDRLRELLCKRFSYNSFLMAKLLDLYPKDILDFLQSNEVDRPLTLRTNALKTRRKDLAQALINRGVNLDPFDKWSKVGLVVYDSQVPLGATPEYLAGHYMLQGAASLLPVLSLGPKPQEKVLDLCAAPGGKTTYLAELMRNTGLVMANEASRDRAKAIVGNAHRHGLNNIVVCVGDGRQFPKTMHNFDRVLVDAPCTGTGVIAKDPAVKVNKEEKDVLKCAHLQKQLLLAGIDALKVGGTLVYCTCSVLTEENEAVVDFGLRRRAVKLTDASLEIGEPGFHTFKGKQYHPSMNLTRRVTPHQHNMDGFFVAKLVKFASSKQQQEKQQQEKQKKQKQQQQQQQQEDMEEDEDDAEDAEAEA